MRRRSSICVGAARFVVVLCLASLAGVSLLMTPAPAQTTEQRDINATRRRSDLQGVRAIAVLLVVLSHAGVNFLQGGFIGVDVFFVLSGFLITGLLIREADTSKAISFIGFYSRRARRILPTAALTLVATDIAAYFLLNMIRARDTVIDSIYAATFTINFRLANQGADYFAQGQPSSPIRQFWSLAVEEQFYVVWPILIVIALFVVKPPSSWKRAQSGRPRPTAKTTINIGRRLAIAIGLLGGASFLWSIYYTNSVPNAAFFSTYTRIWELALGAGLALAAGLAPKLSVNLRAGLGWVGLIAVLAAAVLFTGDTPFPGYAALLPTVGAALVIFCGIPAENARFASAGLLGSLPMRYIGDRSYTLYLLHWPILTIATQHAGHDLGVGTNLLLVLAAGLLSIVVYKFFENPIRHSRWNPPSKALLLVPASILSVLIVVGITRTSLDQRIGRDAVASAPAPLVTKLAPIPTKGQFVIGSKESGGNVVAPTLPAVSAAVLASLKGEKIPSNLTPSVGSLKQDVFQWPSGCNAELGKTTSNICRLGSSGSKRTLVVMGDSHSQMYGPAVMPMADKQGWTVIPIAKPGCNPWEWVDKASKLECRTWFTWAISQIRSLHPDTVLIAGASAGDSPSATKAFTTAATQIKGSVKHTVFLSDTPRMLKQPVDCLLAPGATMRTCTSDWGSPTDTGTARAVSTYAPIIGASYIDGTGWYCDKLHCPMVIGGYIAYIDTGHLTLTYAEQLAGPFATAFNQAIANAKRSK